MLLNSIFLQGFSLVLGSQSEKRAKYIYVVHCNVIDEGTPFHVHPFEGIDRVLVGFSLVLGSQSEKRAKYIYVVHCNVIDEGTPFHVHPFEGIDRVLVRHVETIWRAKTLISFQGLLYVIFKNGESLARVKVEVCST